MLLYMLYYALQSRVVEQSRVDSISYRVLYSAKVQGIIEQATRPYYQQDRNTNIAIGLVVKALYNLLGSVIVKGFIKFTINKHPFLNYQISYSYATEVDKQGGIGFPFYLVLIELGYSSELYITIEQLILVFNVLQGFRVISVNVLNSNSVDYNREQFRYNSS